MARDPPPNDTPVGWQAGAKVRGTWDITSDCLLTILACTWSVQHLNVPGRQDGKWTRWLRSVKWMVIMILFPELIVLHAVFEFVMALQALRHMENNQKFVTLPWWLPRRQSSSVSQRLSRLLKYFSSSQEVVDTEMQPPEGGSWTFTHCFFANMGGFYYKEPDGKKNQFPLTAIQFAKADGYERPSATEEEIQDRSKQDWFAKGVATLQFLQLALSLIVRTNQGLAFSQLETVTLGFAVCGAVIYLVYLYKPQRVTEGIPVSELSGRGFEKTYDSLWDILMNERSQPSNTNPTTTEQSSVPDRVPNDNVPISENPVAHPGVFLLAFASGLFGAMHAIAWHFEFPSTVEKILWQVSTVVAAGGPVLGLVTIPFAQWTISAGDSRLFMRNCLRLMREYSWQSPDKTEVQNAYKMLEGIFIIQDTTSQAARQPYDSILAPGCARKLMHFLEETPTLDLDDKEDFIQQFKSLVQLLDNKLALKKLKDEARTNMFPRKSLLPKALNQGILVLTTVLYCLSRISLLAIAFSSLRKMPESVYVTTPWTAYIPTLGSSS